ncbi:magnesium chelatase subunit H [Halovulum dunhuangense]|uniref:magnesium chelatase n=1 Tax=Halovulum dunhuangense TaxID=1505036 RepID=A0A849KXM9_9RHOB|nr:magnesium chelatase subunit H [Halovulum dunhuangense]NNU79367.1 magnesium chelatase subunit H [Halovulum dunhuangense]
MLDNGSHFRAQRPLNVVIVTLDSHLAGPAERAEAQLARSIPGLSLSVHAAAEWAENPAALDAALEAIATGDIILVTLIFLDEHIQAILPALTARRDHCDAMIGCISGADIVRLTRLGGLDMSQPASGAMALLKKLRGSRKPSGESGAKQMKMLRRLPRILRFIPGKAQDLRGYFLTMQYWLGGSDENIVAMVGYLVSRYATGKSADAARGLKVAAPVEYPDTGVYHPRMDGRIGTDPARLPKPAVEPSATVGLLLLRSYVLAGDTAHYDAVIEGLEARGLAVIPAFAAGLDGRPAMDDYFAAPTGAKVDALLSLTGFSLVGGPAYNDSTAAEAALARLDVPYVAAHALEFQTLGQWQASAGGLGPVETTMLVALPEIDGATNPQVFGGRLGLDGCEGCDRRCRPGAEARAMSPCHERIGALSARVAKLAALRRSRPAARKVAVVLYGFPPNAGAVGTAAYLSVFESLYNTLHAMAAEGYDLEPPASVDALRETVLKGNAATHGQEANVLHRIPADDLVAREPHLREIEAQWGPAPGRAQSDGSGVFVLGARFGKVMVGIQPAFGYEGDPMRLLFERGFAPTHAFSAFYRYLREDFGADVVLHFGMHGALEFMPGKQVGLGSACWPDRLIGDLPNVYLYAANNPSEASLAKRRSGAIVVSHLTPPLGQAGLYKGLVELKASLDHWRRAAPDAPERGDLADIIRAQAQALDLVGPDRDWINAELEIGQLWTRILDTEQALIPQGLHVVGGVPDPRELAGMLAAMAATEGADPAVIERAATLLPIDHETPALLRALSGRYIRPVPGGDLLRSPEILPTGRNLHAFDPFRMPTAFAVQDGRKQAERLLAAHAATGGIPRSVAMVLWGSDNIKSDGGPIAQALALMGAVPRFDSYGRLCGAVLIPLAELGRPRIDVVMTLSGIFRDLLPLQTRLLAEAAWRAATADEPLSQNFVRAHSLQYAEKMGVDLEVAALRVFSNAEGAYGANVNQLIDSGAWTSEEELADAYETRKGFAYGRDGKPKAQGALLKAALADVDLAYQNLESVELGVTTVDHYFDTLGGVGRAVKRARGAAPAVYIGDQTRGDGKVRTLSEQVALETRTRALNPKFYESLLKHGHEGVRQIEAHVTNTMGWSATTGQVEPWVYQRITETFVLDETMRRRLSELNPAASTRMANRLLEAHERAYWSPDDATLDALRRGAEELEDRLEGINLPEVAAE